MSWNATVPTTGSLIVDIPSIHNQNWTAIEDFFSREHYTFTSPLSGRHNPGMLEVIYSGTTAAITGISSPASGALAFDTTLGVPKIYGALGAQWDQINLLPYSRVMRYRAADYSVPPGVGVGILFDTSIIDPLIEWTPPPTYGFKPKASGYYFVDVNLQLHSVADAQLVLNLAHSVVDIGITDIYRYHTALSSDSFSLQCQLILRMGLGDLVIFAIQTNDTTTLEGGPTLSYVNIYRVS